MGVRKHQRFLLVELLGQRAGRDETTARFDAASARACLAHDQAAVVALLDTIPGIGRETAEKTALVNAAHGVSSR